VEIIQCSHAFQAYDEGSIPFTRSNIFNHLKPPGLKFETRPGCCFETFAPLSFSARILFRPLSRAASVSHGCQFAANVLPIIREVQAAGHTSHNAIAGQLNARKIATPRGGRWTHVQVRQILSRGEQRASHQ